MSEAKTNVIRTLDALLTLPDTLVSNAQPVKITATILYYDYRWRNIWLKDGDTCAYMNPSSLQLPIKSGQMVEIEGNTKPGERAINFRTAQFRVLAESNQPPAKNIQDDRLDTKENNNLRVQLEGRVRQVSTLDNHLMFDLIVRGILVKTYVLLDETDKIPSIEEALVRLRGVYAVTTDPSGNFAVAQITVPSLADLEVIEPDLSHFFNAPTHPINALSTLDTNRLVRILGTVKRQNPGKWLQVEDNTGLAQVESWQTKPMNPGDKVEAVGYALAQGPDLFLREGLYRPILGGASNSSIEAKTNELPLLSRIDRIREMPQEEANRGYPVFICGVLTCFQPEAGVWFMQDSTGGIRVQHISANTNSGMQVSDWAEITGKTAAGGIAPIIVNPTVVRRTQAPMPIGREASLEHLWTGIEDCRWVEVRGYVRAVTNQNGLLRMEVSSGGGEFTIRGPQSATLSRQVGAVIRAHGVCSMVLNDLHQITGVELWIPSRQHIEVEAPPLENPFASPMRSIFSIHRFNALNTLYQRVRVAGVVTLHVPGRYLCIQDRADALFVLSQDSLPLQPGDLVEAAGFPGREQRRVVMRDAVYRKTGNSPQPEPATLDHAAPLNEALEYRLIQTEGILLESAWKKDELRLTLQGDTAVFDAIWIGLKSKSSLDTIRAGSRLSIKGIYRVQTDEYHTPRSFRLSLRGPSDVRVLTHPTWWTTTRLMQSMAGLSIVLLLGMGWVAMLRRRVTVQTGLIRQRLEQEAALEARYRELVENASDIILTLDLTGKFTSLNGAAERLLGFAGSDALQVSFADLIAPSQRERFEQVLCECKKGCSAGNFEVDVITRDKRQLTLDISMRPTLENGTPTGIQSIARDITERKRAVDLLKQSEAQLRKLSRAVEQSPVAIMVTSASGTIEYVNPKFTEITGYSFKDVQGKTPRVLKSGEQTPDTYAQLWDAIRAGQQWQGQLRNRKRNGNCYWVSVAISPVKNDKGEITHFIGIEEDITERRELEMQLRQAQKMESVGQLAAGIAHDFNNIMTVIQGHSSLLLDEPGINDEMRESLNQVAASSQRAADLTRQLLTFSRRQVMRTRVLNLSEVLQSFTRMLQRMVGEHITLQLIAPSQLPPIKADPGMMEQVIMNLAVNARDAMPQGGTLRIAADACTVDMQHALRNPEALPGAFIRLAVADTGCGMDMPTQQRIFEPFFTTKDVGKGTGLGLATVYGIVKQHEGWIEVTSEVGKGTTFHIYLPVCNPASTSATHAVEPAQFRSGHETILIVEDESPLRLLLERVLRRYGYRILSAADGAEALALWGQHSATVDLLLTDVVMPNGISGNELAALLQAQKPDLKVIFTSGYSAEFTNTGLPLQEGVNFIPKPYEPAKLIHTIQQCLESKPSVVSRW